MKASSNIVTFMRQEYLRRYRKNSKYSLRAFGRDLAISPSVISEIFANKRQLTETLLHRFMSGLDLDLKVRRELLEEWGSPKGKSSLQSIQLRQDQFHLIADWYHYAILSLVATKDFQPEGLWVGERLGIPTAEAQDAIDRLLKLGLLTWKNGTLVRQYKDVSTNTDIPSAALRLSHRQTLNQAIECLDKIPVEFRDITSLTIPFDIEQMAKIKDLIAKFLGNIKDTTQKSGNRTEVYNLNVQFVPVTNLKARKRGEK